MQKVMTYIHKSCQKIIIQGEFKLNKHLLLRDYINHCIIPNGDQTREIHEIRFLSSGNKVHVLCNPARTHHVFILLHYTEMSHHVVQRIFYFVIHTKASVISNHTGLIADKYHKKGLSYQNGLFLNPKSKIKT